jgi:ethanolamine phosphate phosphodiesterase
MAMGIQQPGFQLLSLAPHQYWEATKSPTTYADAPCFLPGQVGIYLSVYAPFCVISFLAVIISNVPRITSRIGFRQHTKRSSSPPKTTSRLQSGTPDIQMTSDEDSNSPFRLPPPASASSQIPRTNGNMPFSWVPLDRLRGNTHRTEGAGIFSNLVQRPGGPRGLRKRSHKSFVGRCISDVRDIAALPLTLFILISLWVSFS